MNFLSLYFETWHSRLESAGPYVGKATFHETTEQYVVARSRNNERKQGTNPLMTPLLAVYILRCNFQKSPT